MKPPSTRVAGASRAKDSPDGKTVPAKGRSPNDDYVVGYRRPPRETQFRPGKSGNAQGRTKRSTDMGTVLRELLDEPMRIREGERIRVVPKREALARTLLARALSGDTKSIGALIGMRAFGPAAPEGSSAAPVPGESERIVAEFLAHTRDRSKQQSDPSCELNTTNDATTRKGG